ncbi:Basic helix-loop-helix domain-containing protein USF3 [Bienertia sinuspersici]
MQLQECFDDDNNGGNNTPKKGEKNEEEITVENKKFIFLLNFICIFWKYVALFWNGKVLRKMN